VLVLDARPEMLTPLERHALELFSTGIGRAEIAKRLNRSPKTISNALTVAKEKLRAKSLAHAAALFVQASLLIQTPNG
jgi:DNA-binding CsgD family transcriptional regulator